MSCLFDEPEKGEKNIIVKTFIVGSHTHTHAHTHTHKHTHSLTHKHICALTDTHPTLYLDPNGLMPVLMKLMSNPTTSDCKKAIVSSNSSKL